MNEQLLWEIIEDMNGILILDLIIIPNTTRIVFYDMNNSHGNWTDV